MTENTQHEKDGAEVGHRVEFQSEDKSVTTRFVPTSRFGRWTFEDKNIRKWVESNLSGRVLNAAAGKTALSHGEEVVTNDLDPEIDTDLSVDVAELAAHLEPESFDTVVYDPPWSIYQSNLRYDGRTVEKSNTKLNTAIDIDSLPFEVPGPEEKTQLGHSRLAKENFNHLLKPGGRVIELTFHGTCMPARLGYDRIERVIFDPVGEGKSVIGSVDNKAKRGKHE